LNYRESAYTLNCTGSELAAKLAKIDTLNAKLVEVQNELDVLNSNAAYITPEMFGAKGDGVTDDTLAFNQAMEYASNHYGMPVLLSAKTYFLSEGLTITIPGTKIIGTGKIHNDVTGEAKGTNIKSGINDYSVYISVSHVTIEGVSVKGGTNGFKINSSDSNNVLYGIHLKECHTYQTTDCGFIFERLVNCIFDTCTATKTNQGFLCATSGINSTSIEFNHCWARETTYAGFHLNWCYYCTFQNCLCDISKEYSIVLEYCKSISLDACGAEYVGCLCVSTDSDGISLISPFVAMPGKTPENYSYLEVAAKSASLFMSNNSKNAVIMGATSYDDDYEFQVHKDNEEVTIIGGLIHN
jgi:hypothetical protein